MICVNGAAAHCVEPGHKVIIMCYAQMTPEEFADPDNAPRVVFVDDDNRIARVSPLRETRTFGRYAVATPRGRDHGAP